MGRPLNKKYFGNRNIGTASTLDNGIGGEGILSITAAAEKGDVLINSSYPAPILVKPAPTIPGGVTSTSRVIWEVDRIALTSGGADYETTGFPVNVTFTGLGGGVIGRMTATDAGAATTAGINFTTTGFNRGEFIDTPPTEALTYEVCTPGNPTGGGNNAQTQVFFRVKRIEVLTSGSGYTGTETFSWNTAGCSFDPAPGVPTFALTVDSGAVGSATNQENAIQISAFIPTANGGSSAVAGDITKQVSGRRYKVKTAQGTGIVKLVAAAPAAGQANIIATDANGNTYYVTKLTAHRATLTRLVDDGGDSDWLFATGAWTFWSFDAASGLRVQIANA
jgi:hypothetical protein